MGDMVRNSLTEELHKAGYHSLLAKDVSKIVVIYERFLSSKRFRKLLSDLESFNALQCHKAMTVLQL